MDASSVPAAAKATNPTHVSGARFSLEPLALHSWQVFAGGRPRHAAASLLHVAEGGQAALLEVGDVEILGLQQLFFLGPFPGFIVG